MGNTYTIQAENDSIEVDISKVGDLFRAMEFMAMHPTANTSGEVFAAVAIQLDKFRSMEASLISLMMKLQWDASDPTP